MGIVVRIHNSALGSDEGIKANVLLAWERIRILILVPLLKIAIVICAVMSIMLFVERVYMAIVIFCVKLLRRKRYTKYKLEALQRELEATNTHPTVLVQIPMYNEKKVYKLSIRAACQLDWPSDKLIVQVLDDSTDPTIRELVQIECREWAAEGVNIKCEVRSNRNGYKAGALREGLKKKYVSDCDYVAIFDADFQPEPDYLWRTMPFLLSDRELALVQARWKFVNSDNCVMTRFQEMSQDYHFGVEQEVGSSTCSFFGFNGTAGVWRLHALYDAGGWKDRTTVEDMDLAVRASLRGWKFVFVGDLSVKNELPTTYNSYRFQQHRWSCGPAYLFRKMFWEIIFNKRASLWKKFHVIYTFFFVRNIVAHLVTFFFYCIVIPVCVLVPEIRLHKFIALYVPCTITILNAICSPRYVTSNIYNTSVFTIANLASFHLLFFWILFENVMSMHRAKATIIGLLGTSRVKEWVVTEKLGNTRMQMGGWSRSSSRRFLRLRDRVHVTELIVGLYLCYCGVFDVLYGRNHIYAYLFMQAAAFLVMGIGYVGN